MAGADATLDAASLERARAGIDAELERYGELGAHRPRTGLPPVEQGTA